MYECVHRSPGGCCESAHLDSVGPGRARDSAFLTSTLEMLMLLVVHRPHIPSPLEFSGSEMLGSHGEAWNVPVPRPHPRAVKLESLGARLSCQ